jgi:hypothetical protein
MEEFMRNVIVVLLTLFMSFQVVARGGNGMGRGQGRNGDCQLDTMPVGTITEHQAQELAYMWQEEKVARDVYTKLGEAYPNLRIFKNIAKSEQKHMDAVKRLLVRYEIPVPVVDETPGVFALEALQNLYNQLIERGLKSLKDGLTVGYDIEVLDIKDLEELIEGMPDNVQFVFGNLIRASYKHKDAFTRQLSRN